MIEPDADWKAGLGERLDRQDSLLGKLLERQDKQDDLLKDLNKGQSDFIAVMSTWKGAMSFFNVVGRITKPLLWTGGTVAAMWAAYKSK